MHLHPSAHAHDGRGRLVYLLSKDRYFSKLHVLGGTYNTFFSLNAQYLWPGYQEL